MSCTFAVSYGQTFDYGVFTDNNYDDRAFEVAIDSTNNATYIAGSINLGNNIQFISTTFNSNTSLIPTLLQLLEPPLAGSGATDGYLAKLDEDQNLEWIINFGGSGNDEALGVCIGANGNIFVTGYYWGSALFESYDNTDDVTLNSQTDTNMDIFLACYTPDGDLLWARDAGGASNDAAYDIAALSDGVVIAGIVNDDGAQFGSLNVYSQNGSSSYGVFAAKYSHTGSPLWIHTALSDDMNEIPTTDLTNFTGENFIKRRRTQIAAVDNEVVISSMLKGNNISFGNSATGSQTEGNMSGSSNVGMQLSRLASNGIPLSQMELTEVEFQEPFYGLTLEADCQHIFIAMSNTTGISTSTHFSSPTSLAGNGNNNLLLASLYPDFTFQHLNVMGISGGTIDLTYPRSMLSDEQGTLYMAGVQRHKLCSEGLGCLPAAAPTSNDAFFMKLDCSLNANTLWTFTESNEELVSSLDRLGDKLTAGGWTNSTTVSPGANNVSITNNRNSFVLTYDVSAMPFSFCCDMPEAGTIAVSNATPCYGTNVQLTVSDYDDDLQWYSSADGGTNWSVIGGETGDVMNIAIYEAQMFKLVASNNCGSVESNYVLVTPQLYAPAVTYFELTANNNCQTLCPNYTTNFNALGCGTFTQTPAAGATLNGGIHQVTIYAPGGTDAVDTITVNVVDLTPPLITCPANIIQNVNANADYATVTYTIGAADNCTATGLISFSQLSGLPSGSSFSIGTHSVTYEAKDEAGNISTCSFTISISDNIPPAIVCPPDHTVPITAGCDATLPDFTSLVTVSDNATDAASIIIEQDPAAGTVFTGMLTVTLKATDQYGNSATCTFIVTTVDMVSPVITTCPNDTIVTKSASCKFLIPDYTLSIAATDNCSIQDSITLSQFPAPGVVVNQSTLIALSATDEAGNITWCTFTVTPVDTIAPTLSCPGDITAGSDPGTCAAQVDYSISVSDNCNCVSGPIAGFTAIGNFNGHTYYKSTGLATWRSAYNNALSLGGHLVTINSAAENSFLPNNTVNYWIGLTDAFSEGNYTWVTGEPMTFDSWDSGQPDDFGGEDFVHTNHSLAHLWNDDDALALNRYIVEFDCMSQLLVPIGVSLNDINTTYTTLDESSVFPVGISPMTYTATDESGNTATCSFNITVEDNELPYALCEDVQYSTSSGAAAVIGPNVEAAEALGVVLDIATLSNIDDIDLENVDPSDLICYHYVEVSAPTTDDNCGVQSIWNDYTQTDNAFAFYPVGTTTVQWVITDVNGNTETCTSYVEVIDDTMPDITCTDYVSVDNLPDLSDGYVVVPLPTVNGECGNMSYYNDYNGTADASDMYPHWLTYVTFTVTDNAGNPSSCTTVVEVFDSQSPTIECINADTLYVDDACEAVVPDYESILNIYDNCWEGIYIIAQSPGAGSPASDGDILTVTALDHHGHMAECFITLHVVDDILPTSSCPGDMTVSTAAGDTDVYVTVPPASFNDNCGTLAIATFVNGIPAVSASGTYAIGVHTIEWVAVDSFGNSETCSITLIVNADYFPSIACPTDITIDTDVDQCTAYVSVPAPSVSDDGPLDAATHNSPYCDGDIYDASGDYPAGTHTITWTITDENGNTSSCDMMVIVTDEQAPSILCNADQSFDADAGQCAKTIAIDAPTVSDNCAGSISIVATVNGVPGLPASFPIGTTEIIWQATDSNNNSATCPQYITITDNELPQIACEADAIFNTTANSCSGVVSLSPPAFSDNCTGAILQHNNTYLSANPNGLNLYTGLFPAGIHTIAWSVTDASGHSAACPQTVTINDVHPPVITCGADITQSADIGSCGTFVNIPTPFANDNCFVASVINSFNNTSNASDFYPVGTTTVIWTAIDASNNQSTCLITIKIDDNQFPEIICPDSIVASATPGMCSATLNIGNATATDNCSIALISNDHPSNIYSLGTTTVTWTAIDSNGNESTCAQTVTVVDNEYPSFVCPANMLYPTDTSTCTRTLTLSFPTATDNCGIQDISNNITGSMAAPYDFPVGITQVEWTITDVNGNTSDCIQTVIVNDNQNPTITCPANITLNASAGACNRAVTIPVATAADNCGVASIVNSFNSGGANASDTYPVGTTTVTFTVTDVNGNTATCSMTVTINDNQNPTITCPANITLSASAGVCNRAVTIPVATAADNCDIASIVNSINGGGADASGTYPVGTTTVTFTVTDVNGNTATCSMTVTINDYQNPTITCPSNITVNVDAGTCVATVASLEAPTAADNCGVVSVVNNHPSTTYVLGVNTIIWTVTDVNGNTATCNQTVTVLDNIDPAITCPANITVNADTGLCTTTVLAVALGTPTTTDNCSVTSVSNNHPSTTYTIGTNSVIWTVTDGSGNTATCTQTVTVVDNIVPTITCPANITVNVGAGTCTATVLATTLGIPTTADNCSVASVSNNHPSTTYALGANSVVWTVTDGSGNTATCTQTVTVVDNIVPTITCPNDTVINTNVGCQAWIDFDVPLVTDNCGALAAEHNYASAQFTNNSSGLYPLGFTYVTWIATDLSGNPNSCIQTVEVRDTTLPYVECPEDIVVYITDSLLSSEVTVPIPLPNDNCTVSSITNNYTGTWDASAVYPAGIHTVQWLVIDSSGNEFSCVQTISVIDSIAPIVSCHSYSDTTLLDSCGALVDLVLPTTSSLDNFTYLNIDNNSSEAFADYFEVGTHYTTWHVYDQYGNEASCTDTIHVFDTQLPIVLCTDTLIVQSEPGLCGANVLIEQPIIDENCSILSLINSYNNFENASDFYPLGFTTFNWSTLDINGNFGFCTQTVWVQPSVSTEIICPSDQVLEADEQGQVIVHDFTTQASVISNCPFQIVQSIPADASIHADTTIVLYIFEQGELMDSCSFNLSVVDVIAPTFECPDTIIQLYADSTCQYMLDDYTALIDDSSIVENSAYTLHQWPEADSIYNSSSIIKLWIEDSSGNTSDTCFVAVATLDSIAPSTNNSEQIFTLGLGQGCMVEIPDFQQWIIWQDNCDEVLNYSQTPEAFTEYYGAQTITATYTAMDDAGNSSIYTLSIVLQDTIAPTINAEFGTILSVGNDCSLELSDFSSQVFVEDCSATSISEYYSQNTLNAGDSALVTIVATDAYDNVSFLEVMVYAIDNNAPFIEQVNDTTVFTNPGSCTAMFYAGLITAYDNCSQSLPITIIDNPGVYFSPGIYSLNYFATDAAGNSSDTLAYTLTVIDGNPPQFIPLDTNYYTTCDLNFAYPQVYMTLCDNQIINAIDASEPLAYGENLIQFISTIEGDEEAYSYIVNVVPPIEVEWIVPDTVCAGNDFIDLTPITSGTYLLFISVDGSNMPIENFMLNTQGLTTGSYDLILDITSDSCTNDILQTLNIVEAPSNLIVEEDLSSCGNEIMASISYPYESISWSVPENIVIMNDGEIISFISSTYGNYTITAEAEFHNCIFYDTVSVTYSEPPVPPDAGQDQTIYLVNQLMLNGDDFGTGTTIWSVAEGSGYFTDATLLATQVTGLTLGENTYILQSTNGICIAYDTIVVSVYGLEIPSGYSPNDDGTNDYFEIPGIENLSEASLTVLNRWGQVVFESRKYVNEWKAQNVNGEQLPDDTYFYELKLKEEKHQGFVVIKR